MGIPPPRGITSEEMADMERRLGNLDPQENPEAFQALVLAKRGAALNMADNYLRAHQYERAHDVYNRRACGLAEIGVSSSGNYALRTAAIRANQGFWRAGLYQTDPLSPFMSHYEDPSVPFDEDIRTFRGTFPDRYEKGGRGYRFGWEIRLDQRVLDRAAIPRTVVNFNGLFGGPRVSVAPLREYLMERGVVVETFSTRVAPPGSEDRPALSWEGGLMSLLDVDPWRHKTGDPEVDYVVRVGPQAAVGPLELAAVVSRHVEQTPFSGLIVDARVGGEVAHRAALLMLAENFIPWRRELPIPTLLQVPPTLQEHHLMAIGWQILTAGVDSVLVQGSTLKHSDVFDFVTHRYDKEGDPFYVASLQRQIKETRPELLREPENDPTPGDRLRRFREIGSRAREIMIAHRRTGMRLVKK